MISETHTSGTPGQVIEHTTVVIRDEPIVHREDITKIHPVLERTVIHEQDIISKDTTVIHEAPKVKAEAGLHAELDSKYLKDKHVERTEVNEAIVHREKIIHEVPVVEHQVIHEQPVIEKERIVERHGAKVHESLHHEGEKFRTSTDTSVHSTIVAPQITRETQIIKEQPIINEKIIVEKPTIIERTDVTKEHVIHEAIQGRSTTTVHDHTHGHGHSIDGHGHGHTTTTVHGHEGHGHSIDGHGHGHTTTTVHGHESHGHHGGSETIVTKTTTTVEEPHHHSKISDKLFHKH